MFDFDLIGAHIREYGVSLVHVPEDYRHPYYSYTVGLSADSGATELLVVGLEHQTAHDLLNELAADPTAQALEGSTLELRPVPEDLVQAYAEAAVKHFGGPVKVRQVVWSDHEGRYPDHEDCHPFVVNHQPLLHTLSERYDNPAWAFQEPPWTKVQTTADILAGTADLGFVRRTEDHEWHFLARPEDADGDLVSLTLRQMLERFPPLLGIAGLGAGEAVYLEEAE